MKNKLFLILFFVINLSNLLAQDTLKVLFLGNSYTSFNNLPSLAQSLSTSAGKTLIIDSNMPGGFTVSGHVNDAVSIGKISQGNWDYIVIQEQSQIPTIDFYRYNDMYPAIGDLKMLAEQINPCTKLITYMTWGRRYGGQQCDPSNTYCSPVFTDFNHMQDTLTRAYTEISDQLGIQCAPAGVTWQNILNDTNLVLHASDNSHPNIDGSYVAALTLFSSIWKQPSSGISYNAGLSPARALYYQQKSDFTIFNSPNDWNLYINNPFANFNYSSSGNTITFTNLSSSASLNALNYFWNFGDGNTSTAQNPSHTYASTGTYSVSLIVSNCIFSDTITISVQTGTTGILENSGINFITFPNPVHEILYMKTDKSIAGSKYIVTNSLGESIFEGEVKTDNIKIDFSNLPVGFYYLRILGEYNQTKKIIKE